MKVAAVQIRAEFCKVEENLKLVKKLAIDAFKAGAEMVIIPEFFTSAIGFHPDMLAVSRPLEGEPTQLLNELAKQYNGIIGGSFIARKGEENFNTFVLAFPDGQNYFHSKDQPTMWENCYYIGGNDDGILETEIGKIGVALCWEFVRTRTVKRLINQVDIVVGGSCWWTLPISQQNTSQNFHDSNLDMMIETPATFAKLLGVHVIHAAHAGEFEGKNPINPRSSYNSYYLGETQIVEGSGKILNRMQREEGNGFIMEDIDIYKKWNPSKSIPNSFWIPNMSKELIRAWDILNAHGESYYRETTRPYIKKSLEK